MSALALSSTVYPETLSGVDPFENWIHPKLSVNFFKCSIFIWGYFFVISSRSFTT
jgi:hypothetical protein